MIKLKITEAEMSVMRILWDAEGPITSKEVMSLLTDKEWKYTTLVTILGNLADKDIVLSEKVRRKHAHLYSPIISEQDYIKQTTKEFIDSTHKSSLKNALCAIFDCQLTDEQYKQLEQTIEGFKNV